MIVASVESSSRRASPAESTGVFPLRITTFGPFTDAAGFTPHVRLRRIGAPVDHLGGGMPVSGPVHLVLDGLEEQERTVGLPILIEPGRNQSAGGS